MGEFKAKDTIELPLRWMAIQGMIRDLPVIFKWTIRGGRVRPTAGLERYTLMMTVQSLRNISDDGHFLLFVHGKH